MNRFALLALATALSSVLGACGNTSFLGDLGQSSDMAMTAFVPFKLQSGTYKITKLTVGADGCNADPLNAAMDPAVMSLLGSTLVLANNGGGDIGLGSQNGTPKEYSNGESCPGAGETFTNPACASAPSAQPFTQNMGTLVRDNTVDDMAGCTFHRHVENQVAVTADNLFDSSYVRTDTIHAGCTQKTDCTSTWTWTFSKQ